MEDAVENERYRRKQQIIDICNEYGYTDIDNWTVVTTLTPSNKFYTRFAHTNTSTYFKTLKSVREEVQRLMAEKRRQRRREKRRLALEEAAVEQELVEEVIEEEEEAEEEQIAEEEEEVQQENIADEIGEIVKQIADMKVVEKCGICLEECDNEVTLKCGHAFCGECIGGYLTHSDGDSLFDHVYALAYCPTCKQDDKQNHITSDILEECLAKKFIDEQCLMRLNAMSTQFVSSNTIYSCMNTGCVGKWEIDDVPRGNGNKFDIECPVCGMHQCCNCQIPWIKFHRCIDHTVDEATRKLIESISVICPGNCGQSIEKMESEKNVDGKAKYCNVMRCLKDRIYVCGLCGQKLDSSEFDPFDRNHRLANKHFFHNEPGPEKCKGHLFTDRGEWLEIQKKKHETKEESSDEDSF